MSGARQATVRISAEGWWREFVKLALEGLGVGLFVSLVLALAVFIAATHAEAAPLPAAGASSGGQLSFDDGAGGRITAPRVATDVHMDVGGLVARVLVVQRFVNPSAQWREGVYSFPLPENAAVDRMRIETAGRVVEGVVRERGEAKRAYEQAKAEGRKAALVDQERPNLFTTRVAHVGPGEVVAVTIEYQQTLRYDDGVFRLRFPLAVTPRYVPGAPLPAVDTRGSTLLPEAADHASRATPGPMPVSPDELDLPSLALPTDAVPDADRITPPVAAPGARLDATLTVDLHAGFPLVQLESRYHRANIETLPGHVYRIELADEAPAARDFELVWAPDAGAAPGAAVFAETRDGITHALLMLVPPAVDTAGRAPRAPREITYIVDTSGSMEGVSIAQAREALGWALDRLAPGDRFNVIEFNTVTRSLFGAPMPVDPATVAQARRFVAGLRARGGTEMLPALTAALAGEASPGVLRQVVFLTDGAVGNEDALFALIRARLGDRRLYTVGIGPAPNAWFMQKAAQEGRGTYTFIGDVRETATKMTALFRKLESPVLTDLAVEWPSTAEVWPARLPDLFAGEPLSMTAALPAAARSGDVVVRGRLDGAPWSARLPLAGAVPQAGVGALWGRAKIDSLMDAMRHGAPEDATRAEVVRVALAHRLVSRYTSLVAVDATPSAPPGSVAVASRIALPLPEGLSHEAILGVPQTATPMPALLAGGAAALLAALALLVVLRRREVGIGC